MDISQRPTPWDAIDEKPVMPPVFAVVGENRDDPDCLLLLGDDGQHYQYQLADGTTTPVIPDDSWVIDHNPLTAEPSMTVPVSDPEPA